jgi:hypothetical protein
MEEIMADRVIAKYIEDRDKKAALNKEIEAINALQAKREAWLANNMTQNHEKGKNTEAGSCSFYTFESATVSDPLVFLGWVGEDFENRKHFLENRVNKTAVKQKLADDKTLPPAISYTTIKKVRVTRPKTSK